MGNMQRWAKANLSPKAPEPKENTEKLSPKLEALKRKFKIYDWWNAYKTAAHEHEHPTWPIAKYINNKGATDMPSKCAVALFKFANDETCSENVDFLIRVRTILNRPATVTDEQHHEAMVKIYKQMIAEESERHINLRHEDREAFNPYTIDVDPVDTSKWFKKVGGVEPDSKQGPFDNAARKIYMLTGDVWDRWKQTKEFDDFLRDNEVAIKKFVNKESSAHSGHYNQLSMFDDHVKNEILAYDHYPRRYQVDDYLYGQNKMDNANVHTFGGYDGADDIYLEQVIGTTVILMALTILCCVCIGVAICWMYGIYTFKKKMDESKKKEDRVYQIANDEESII